MHDTLHYAIFHENFEVGIYIQKAWHFAFCGFFYTKSLTLYKKQDNLRYVFILKNPDNLYYAIFHWIFVIDGEWGGVFICKNKCTLCYVFRYKKPDTLRYIFIWKKMHFALRFYL